MITFSVAGRVQLDKERFARSLLCLFVLLSMFTMTSGECRADTVTISGPDAPVNGSQYTANGGTAPYTWCISKGSITQAGIVTVSNLCGSATITATDACGNSVTKDVNMPNGGWYVTSSQSWAYGNCGSDCTCTVMEGNRKVQYGLNCCNKAAPGGMYYIGYNPCQGACEAWTCSSYPNWDYYLRHKNVLEWKCQDGTNGFENTCTPPPCNLSISAFAGSSPTINPGQGVTFTGTISSSASWTISIAGQTFSGTGTTASATWDGKDLAGKYVAEGNYSATLTASSCNGSCTDSKIATVQMEYICIDADGDGHFSIKPSCSQGDDCNDNDPSVYPGASELCDGKDHNCNGLVDEGCWGNSNLNICN